MCGHVSSLVVSVDGEVQTHAVGELSRVVSKLLREVGRHVQVRVTGDHLWEGEWEGGLEWFMYK